MRGGINVVLLLDLNIPEQNVNFYSISLCSVEMYELFVPNFFDFYPRGRMMTSQGK